MSKSFSDVSQTYSVVIPSIGRKSITSAVKSVLEQSVPPYEIIIVGFFTEELSKLIENQGVLFTNVVVNLQEMPNAARSRNLGLEIAKGEYVAFLDDDDVWLPKKMECQLDFLRNNPKSICASRAIVESERISIFCGKKEVTKVRPKTINCLQKNQNLLEVLYRRVYLVRNRVYIPTPCLVMRREIALLEKFDETMEYLEDIDWLFRLQLRGVLIDQLEEVLVKINASLTRSIHRENLFANQNWGAKVAATSKLYGARYLFGQALRSSVIKASAKSFLIYISQGFKYLVSYYLSKWIKYD
jgi:glycosyltransferase involved in cell wall biosynthesis